MHYLDTCVCIEFLRGRLRSGYREMRSMGCGEFALPSIVVAELYYGAEHSAVPTRELRIVEQFVDAFEAIPFDTSCAREYARIRQELSACGRLIGDCDMMIAATAIANQATLVTQNYDEFKRVSGLRLEAWKDIDF